MSNEKLTEIREYIVNNIMRNPDYMFHWTNKVGGWVENDLFTKEDSK